MAVEKRRLERRNVTYYITVNEAGTPRILGVIMDISPGGFRLDSREQIPEGIIRNFYIDLPNDEAPKSARMFTGRSKWCQPDYIDPTSYNVGYEFINISKGNAVFFQRFYEQYGSKSGDGKRNNNDYLWR
jgi:hypothetical protein